MSPMLWVVCVESVDGDGVVVAAVLSQLPLLLVLVLLLMMNGLRCDLKTVSEERLNCE